MLHAGHPPAVGHRLVERVAGRVGAELLAVARAEALDRLLVEQRFRRRHQGEGLGLVGRALVGGIEAAQALDLVAEEVEPERLLLAGREQVDERPAHRIFAMLGDGVGALVAKGVQLLDQLLALDPLALGDAPGQLADAERASAAAGSRHWRWRPAAAALSRFACSAFSVASRSAITRRAGRSAVVGQAVPGREGQHLDLGREQRHGVGKRAHRRFVGGDHHRAAALPDAVRRAREVGREPRQEARRHAGQGQRRGRPRGCAAAARSSSADPDEIEAFCEGASHHRPCEALRRLGGCRSPRP